MTSNQFEVSQKQSTGPYPEQARVAVFVCWFCCLLNDRKVCRWVGVAVEGQSSAIDYDLRGQSARGAGRESIVSCCGCGGTPSNGFRGVENAEEEEEQEWEGGVGSSVEWRHACFRSFKHD